MFTIYDGRSKFYQWDIDRKLVIADKTITQVHFANCLCPNARKCEVYEVEEGVHVVDVPNDLLTEYMDIRVWGYDSGMTKYEAVFQVQRRTKPADYVYTQEEVKAWEQIYEDTSLAKYIWEQPYIDIARVPCLPLLSLNSRKAEQRWTGPNNPTLNNRRVYDAQTELKLCIETDYESIERTIHFKEPAIMWQVNWLEGMAYVEHAYKILDTSKLHSGLEKGYVYTTFEEQGWEPKAKGNPMSNCLTHTSTMNVQCSFWFYDDGRIRILVNPIYTLEQTIDALNEAGEVVFIYLKDAEYRNWEQVCEPLDTKSKHSDDRWFYADIPSMDDNVAWSCGYYEPLYNTLHNLEEKVNDLGGNISQAVSDYLDENPVEVDMTGYATEDFVNEAVENISLTPGPQGPAGKDGKDGAQGPQGEPGDDGYTPVKGTDYWTAADKAEIVDEVLASLGTENWVFTLEDGSTITKAMVIGNV